MPLYGLLQLDELHISGQKRLGNVQKLFESERAGVGKVEPRPRQLGIAPGLLGEIQIV
jgi:hypothetical protein